MSEFWDFIEPTLREQAYATMDADPQSLLEHDGGPEGMTADVVMARLIGFDDQIVKDGWRRERADPVLLLPIHERPKLTASLAPTEADLYPTMRTARYVLQSGYVVFAMDAVLLPLGVPHGPDFRTTFLYLRYRRRA